MCLLVVLHTDCILLENTDEKERGIVVNAAK